MLMLCTVRLSRQESSVSLQSFIAEDALKSLSGLKFKDLAKVFFFIYTFYLKYPGFILFLPLVH